MKKLRYFSELFHYSIDFSFMKWYTDKKRETSDKWVVLLQISFHFLY